MAYFPPFNGDAQPVFALDISNGPQTGNIGSTAALVQMDGPKLDFFKVIVQNAGNQVQINQAIQRTATIAKYQVQGDDTGQISYAVYPSGAWTAATLDAALKALGNVQITASDGTVTGVNVSGTDVTNPGFKLA